MRHTENWANSQFLWHALSRQGPTSLKMGKKLGSLLSHSGHLSGLSSIDFLCVFFFYAHLQNVQQSLLFGICGKNVVWHTNPSLSTTLDDDLKTMISPTLMRLRGCCVIGTKWSLSFVRLLHANFWRLMCLGQHKLVLYYRKFALITEIPSLLFPLSLVIDLEKGPSGSNDCLLQHASITR